MSTLPTAEWEIFCGNPGNNVVEYGDNISEVLDFCGRVLYGNTLFDVLLLKIPRMEPNHPDTLGYEYDPVPDKQPEWVMKTLMRDGEVRCRLLENKHELFGMLIAELKMGTSYIEVCHISNACEP